MTALASSIDLAEQFVALRNELLAFLRIRLGDHEVAQELLQELWVRLAATETTSIVNPRAYLYRAAQNLALDHVRAKRRRIDRETDWALPQRSRTRDGDVPDPATSALDDMLERERLELLRRAIDGLPFGAGRAFRLHKLEGLPHAEVASVMGISKSGVEKHIAVAMAHLRRTMVN